MKNDALSLQAHQASSTTASSTSYIATSSSTASAASSAAASSAPLGSVQNERWHQNGLSTTPICGTNSTIPLAHNPILRVTPAATTTTATAYTHANKYDKLKGEVMKSLINPAGSPSNDTKAMVFHKLVQEDPTAITIIKLVVDMFVPC